MQHSAANGAALAESRLLQAATAEARALLAVEARGCHGICRAQCSNIRDVLDVPPRVLDGLRAFVDACPEDAEFVQRALRFRVQVAKEVRRLRGLAVAA